MSSTQIIFTDNVERYRKSVLEDLKGFNITCIAEASNGLELLRLLKDKRPDVVLLDLQMPVMNGSEALNKIAEEFPYTNVIILSMYYEALLVEDFIRRGAKGYIAKDELLDIRILSEAIETVKNGGIFIYPKSATIDEKVIKYTQKQKEITPFMCQGFTNEQIAVEMNVSVRAVEKLRSKMYAKIEGEKAIDFYRYAFSKGLQFLKGIHKK